MNPLDLLFGQIANTVKNHADPNTPGPSYDANPLLGALAGIFGQHANQAGGQFQGYREEEDYSQYGGFDPGQLFGGQGNQGGQLPPGVRPASEDPYGDPADQGGGGMFGRNVRPASEDPYGDPADQR